MNYTYFTGALIAPVNATAGGWQNDNTQSFLADSTDLVGIGTSTPWGKLAINLLAGDANQFVVGSSTQTSFIIANNNRVGVGTTTPWQLLSVNGTIAANAILPNGPYTNNLSAFDLGTTTARWNALWAGTLNVGTSTFSLKSDSSSNLGFFTAASGGGTQAMTLTSSGNVGIGTTSPRSLVEISGADVSAFTGTGNGLLTLRGTTNSVTQYAALDFSEVGEANLAPAARVGAKITSSGTFLQFGTSNSYASGITNTAMTIDPSGNIGIGTTTPARALNVAGSASSIQLRLERTTSNTGVAELGADNTGFHLWPTYYASNNAPFNIDTSGNVGIGTTSPNKLLTVAAGGTAAALRLDSTSSAGPFLEFTRASGAAYWQVGNDGGVGGTDSFFIYDSAGASQGTRLVVDQSGNVGIGTTSPMGLLAVAGNAYAGAFYISSNGTNYGSDRITFPASVGNYYVLNQSSVGVVLPNGNTAWSAQSDERLKTNIETLTATSGLDAVLALNPVSFNWKNPGASTSTQLGFIAQEVQQIFPQLITRYSATIWVRRVLPHPTLFPRIVSLSGRQVWRCRAPHTCSFRHGSPLAARADAVKVGRRSALSK